MLFAPFLTAWDSLSWTWKKHNCKWLLFSHRKIKKKEQNKFCLLLTISTTTDHISNLCLHLSDWKEQFSVIIFISEIHKFQRKLCTATNSCSIFLFALSWMKSINEKSMRTVVDREVPIFTLHIRYVKFTGSVYKAFIFFLKLLGNLRKPWSAFSCKLYCNSCKGWKKSRKKNKKHPTMSREIYIYPWIYF